MEHSDGARRPGLISLVLLRTCSNTSGNPYLLCGEITRFLLLQAQINTSQSKEITGSITGRVDVLHLKSVHFRSC